MISLYNDILISFRKHDILLKTQLFVLTTTFYNLRKELKEMAEKTITKNEFTFKCDESNFTDQEFLRWCIARDISECNDVEKLRIIDSFISRYLSK